MLFGGNAAAFFGWKKKPQIGPVRASGKAVKVKRARRMCRKEMGNNGNKEGNMIKEERV